MLTAHRLRYLGRVLRSQCVTLIALLQATAHLTYSWINLVIRDLQWLQKHAPDLDIPSVDDSPQLVSFITGQGTHWNKLVARALKCATTHRTVAVTANMSRSDGMKHARKPPSNFALKNLRWKLDD